MFLKLTNIHENHLGEPVILNSSNIVSVRRGKKTPESQEDVTFVFLPPHGVWYVKESIEDIYKMLKKRV
ncbi:MAG: hypothetical protein RLZ10_180 [Bacteroidota bacterium]|jgi:hypothetical protein